MRGSRQPAPPGRTRPAARTSRRTAPDRAQATLSHPARSNARRGARRERVPHAKTVLGAVGSGAARHESSVLRPTLLGYRLVVLWPPGHPIAATAAGRLSNGMGLSYSGTHL